MIKKLILFVLLLMLLAAAWFWIALRWSYSSGERVGYVQKFSNKGWICKTWEGEVALVSMPGSMTEKFYFTVHDDNVARQIQDAMGKRVALHYEEKVGLPTTCFGETRHFVTRVVSSADAPGGALTPAPAPAPAPAAAPTPSPGATPSPSTAPAATHSPVPVAPSAASR